MGPIARLVALAGLLVSLAAMSSLADEPRLTPEEFAILPWGRTPGDDKVLREVYDCGFNLAGFVAPDGVDAVGRAGLKCIVSDERITSGVAEGLADEAAVADRVARAVGPLRDHPAVYGWYLRDEPAAGAYDMLAAWSRAVRATAPNHRPYINLFPIYATKQGLGVDTYGQYVDLFATKVRPAFLSYDNYSLMADGSLRDGYFENLEVMRAASLKHGMPFWNIVLSNGHFRYSEPTEAGLRFQMYTTLAYGGRGISYFTYFTPPIGNYRLGPIDPFGDKTPTWHALRRTNLQIHKLGPTYLRLTSVNVFHHPDVPQGCAPIASAKVVGAVGGGDFCVGEFTGPDERPFAMVVNKSLRESCRFSVTFKAPGRVQMVNPYSGGTQAWAGENDWLAPGQGMLLTVEP